MTAVEDQTIAGLIMKSGGNLVLLVTDGGDLVPLG